MRYFVTYRATDSVLCLIDGSIRISIYDFDDWVDVINFGHSKATKEKAEESLALSQQTYNWYIGTWGVLSEEEVKREFIKAHLS